jgi:hypothetical protein
MTRPSSYARFLGDTNKEREKADSLALLGMTNQKGKGDSYTSTGSSAGTGLPKTLR